MSLGAVQMTTFLIALVLPILAIVAVSFWKLNGFSMVPDFTLENYLGIFHRLTISSLIVPSILVALGIGIIFSLFKLSIQ